MMRSVSSLSLSPLPSLSSPLSSLTDVVARRPVYAVRGDDVRGSPVVVAAADDDGDLSGKSAGG
jgi:hypothetical protein